MNPRNYPRDWRVISLKVREREGWRCQECGAEQGKPHPRTGSRVILTVHHECVCRDSDGRKCGHLDHLAALCQGCHLRRDLPTHKRNAAITRRLKRRNLELFEPA